ncbi:MAG TPA: UDP-glucose/GDP-mannose dehydrogenase family protein [Microlunatus sp.]
MKISVIGCGYLGAVHAACLASQGHDVIGIESDPERAALLNAGEPTFYEPGFPAVLRQALDSGQLRFSSDPAAAAGCRVHFLCVGTPQRSDSPAADLTVLWAAARALLPQLRPGDLVVGKSTVPVGTAPRLAELINTASEVGLAWNPEFLREGTAVADTLGPDRLVYGIGPALEGDQPVPRPELPDAVAILDQVYADQRAAGTPRIVTDYATAELVKAAANSFLATKISFINAMAELCESTGGDVRQLADALGLDNRIGRHFLNAGLGFGGGCLPKDIRAFTARAEELGLDRPAELLRTVDKINSERRTAAVALTGRMLGGSLLGRRVTVLGATFKPLSDDVRCSPSLDVAVQLQDQGARVLVTDPEGVDNARKACPDLELTTDLETAVADAEVLVLATEWPLYRDLDPDRIGRLVAERRIVDCRSVLDPLAWQRAGWIVAALGRPTAQPAHSAA